jgi:Fe-S-cluster containining protein
MSNGNRYNCLKCPAYCCSYTRIIVTPADIRRLAKYHGISVAKAREKFTRKGYEKGERILRHKADEHFTTICRFVDSETRRCTIYEGRPKICREFPGTRHCGYYDFLAFERRTQEDPEYISTTG